MPKARLNDLRKAREVLQALKLDSAVNSVSQLEKKVASRRPLGWDDLLQVLERIEGALEHRDSILKSTFEMMEKIILESLDKAGARNRSQFQKRALAAPPIDGHVEQLDHSLAPIHGEIEWSLKHTGRELTIAYLLMFGILVRWQVLNDISTEWVGHWGQGVADEKKRAWREILLTVKFARETATAREKSNQILQSDSTLYRNAIAHGDFAFEAIGRIRFWNRDKKGVRRDLPPLNSADLGNLYNLMESRLRMMEAFARILRTWGRHSASM